MLPTSLSYKFKNFTWEIYLEKRHFQKKNCIWKATTQKWNHSNWLLKISDTIQRPICQFDEISLNTVEYRSPYFPLN